MREPVKWAEKFNGVIPEMRQRFILSGTHLEYHERTAALFGELLLQGRRESHTRDNFTDKSRTVRIPREANIKVRSSVEAHWVILHNMRRSPYSRQQRKLNRPKDCLLDVIIVKAR